MKLTIDEVEEAMNTVLGGMPEPEILPVIDPDGKKVGESFSGGDLYAVFHRENHPDIYDGLRGRVVLLIRGTHVRVFETLDEAMDFGKALSSPAKIIGGPPLQDMTLEELQNDFLVDLPLASEASRMVPPS